VRRVKATINMAHCDDVDMEEACGDLRILRGAEVRLE